jgi:N-acetylglucosaminyldiphosphoundecaprenol N-acetyl-beta-D-mannosaminyltransferase
LQQVCISLSQNKELERVTKVDVLGVQFDNYNMRDFLRKVEERFLHGQGTFIVTANPEIVMYAREHDDYARLIDERADMVSADGIGVVKGAAMLGTPLPERVTGYDLMTNLLAWGSEEKMRVYLIGAKADVNEAAVARVQRDYPDLTVVGARDGYFDLSDQKVLADVIAAEPDMVFAALGFPKQENFLNEVKKQLPGAILMGVGGSFDVLSGKAKRAPKLVQNMHMEWLYRLAKQPSRIGRMAVLPQFLRAVRRSNKNK